MRRIFSLVNRLVLPVLISGGLPLTIACTKRQKTTEQERTATDRKGDSAIGSEPSPSFAGGGDEVEGAVGVGTDTGIEGNEASARRDNMAAARDTTAAGVDLKGQGNGSSGEQGRDGLTEAPKIPEPESELNIGAAGLRTGDQDEAMPTPSAQVFGAVQLSPRSGSNVRGTVRLARPAPGSATNEGIIVVVHIEGAKPGRHGLHVHEKGDCSAADASSAGDHYNPTGAKHAGPTSARRHAGDLGNIEVGQGGRADAEFVVEPLNGLDLTTAFLGRAMILHEQADDLVSQPAGNAGNRIACGIVEKVDPAKATH